jgi:hypothetical protein
MTTRIAYFCIESLDDYQLKPDKPIESCFFLKHDIEVNRLRGCKNLSSIAI